MKGDIHPPIFVKEIFLTSDTRFKIALTVLLIACFSLFVKNVLGKENPVTLDLLPQIFVCSPNEKPQIRIRATVAKNADNREVKMSWQSADGESGSSAIQMEGENSPSVFTIFRNVTCGNYDISVCVHRTTTKFCTAKHLEGGGR